MSYYFFKLTPPRPTFAQDMTPAEQEVMQVHGAYWYSLAEQGVAIAVGPVGDPAGVWGFAIVEVADEAAAQAIADGDPVRKAGLAPGYDMFPIPQIVLRK